ncbi:MAG: hypothetical protein WC650_04200 [Candidatus Doudnabacteria bacterium]
MSQKIKTICLILISFAVLIGAAFYGIKIALVAEFLGVFAAIFVISLILTFIWKKCTKKEITRKSIIISTIIAGIIRFLISSAYTIDLTEVILIIVAVPCVLLIRLRQKDELKD